LPAVDWRPVLGHPNSTAIGPALPIPGLAEFFGMSRLLLKVLFLTPALFVAVDQPPSDSQPLQVGKDLPGSFHPYNVTGPRAGKFHCQVTEHNYEPGVLVFVREFDAPDARAAVRPLLTTIDDRIEKNYTRIRLSCFAGFITDVLKDVSGTKGDAKENAKNDDLREKFEKDLKDLANSDPKLKHVIVGLDDKDDLKKYSLDDSKFVTVVLYKRLQIVAVFALAKNELNDKKVSEINDAITEKLGATRK
jgi:hypothetical protein